MEQTFEQELRKLINSHSIENESNTPDHILAQYMLSCLAAYTNAINNRDDWYAIDVMKTYGENREKLIQQFKNNVIS